MRSEGNESVPGFCCEAEFFGASFGEHHVQVEGPFFLAWFVEEQAHPEDPVTKMFQ